MLPLLRAVARTAPAHPLVISPRGVFTYGDVLADAETIAAGLRERGVTRVGAVARRAEEMVTLLAAGAIAGVEVCGYPLEDAGSELDRLATRLDHTTVIAGAQAESVPARVRVELGDLRGGGEPPAPAEDSTVLILTTGTTGERRGAIHRWSRLAPGPPAGRPDETTRWLLAYNLSQFAGMAILVHVLTAGATLVQPARQRAGEGVQAIREHGVTHVSATPTFWRGIVRELGPAGAAPSLRQITLGGEAVPGPLLDALRERFPHARVSQIYAATEFGQTGSVRDGRPGLPASVLERPDDAPVRLRVVDGELQVRSRVGMLGYYGEAPIDPDAWRPTGDLVEVVDGRLLFAGRVSEVINVGGVKVHPGAVERIVAAVPGVAAAVAYGRPNALTGQIVAVQVVLADGHDPDGVKDAVREACAVLAPAARPRSVKVVDELVTQGQKVNRRLLAEGTR